MKVSRDKYLIYDIFIIGFAMFAIFFGAGNLIFPPYIGFEAGSGWLPALMGVLLTGMLLPVLAVVAIGLGGGSFERLAKPVAPWFGTVIILISMVIISWLIITPRTAGVSFETGVMTLFPKTDPKIGSMIFIPAYFLAALYFAIDQNQVIDKVGRILTPFLLILLVIIVLWAVIAPLDQPTAAGKPNPFYFGFITGYQTGDVFTGLIFGIIFVDAIKSKGYIKTKDYMPVLIGAAAITFLGLFIVYGGLEYLGATGRNLFPADISKSQLLSELVNRLAGNLGAKTLAVAVILACLTTAIGAITTMSRYMEKWSYGWLSYKQSVIITTVVSAFQAYGGVEYIVSMAGPIFMLFYPVGICLVVLGILSPFFSNDGIWKGVAVFALLIGLYDSLNILSEMAGFTIPVKIQTLYQMIPLSSSGFAWLLPSITGGLIGGILWKIMRMPNMGYEFE